MGLAICGIAFYHAPFVINSTALRVFHSILNCGVDMFLFLSGIGACHSIRSRGGKGYLKQRALRLLPGLWLFLIPWSLLMAALGLMRSWEVLGSVTLVGWWLGQTNQLNWYFSAVWMFFLLAVPVYGMLRRTKRSELVFLGLAAGSLILGLLCPWDYLMTAVARLPVFFTGMLFGTLEQRSFSGEAWLRWLLYPLMALGLVVAILVNLGYDDYGYSLGLWWYPYWLMTPGVAVGISDLAALAEKNSAIQMLLRPLRLCGESSAEILMVHMGIYKIILYTRHVRNRVWLVLMVGCIVLGCLYRRYVVRKLPQLRKKLTHFTERY